MLNSLKSASLITLGILSGFVFTIFAVAAYLLGEINVPFLILSTVVFNFIMWMAGPLLNDLMMKIFYKMKFFSSDELNGLYPEVLGFLQKVCTENNIKIPKIGVIDDDNPTAFTYGSLPSNARIVFTKGLFTYLNQEEREAVLAHEVGHIAHYDFVIMTIASTLVQILYEVYAVLSRVGARGSSGRKKGSILALIALMSYVFYFIGTYLLLYLSRVREYYADEFSAKTTGNPNSLSWALIKIAYGIVAKKDDDKSMRLMESTRAMGVLDVRSAKGLGMVQRFSDNPQLISQVMAFDFVSPWAFILEIGSTHPLTGKRIEKMTELAESMGREKVFNIRETINSLVIDKARLYNNFYIGALIYFLPALSILAGLVFSFFTGNIGTVLVFYGFAALVQAFYKFPDKIAEKSTIRELMADIYSSPVRGRKVALEGRVVGRGDAGGVLSEDLMFEDNGGIIYLDYSSSAGALGNMFFALTKMKKIIGQSIGAEGWFFRGIGQAVSLDHINAAEGKINSYPRLWTIFTGIAMIIIGIII